MVSAVMRTVLPRGLNLLRDSRAVLTVFAATLFLSASLLFSVQPMFAKIVLPKLGGAPSVWAVSMCFFQAVLLAGYCYAHALNRFLSLERALVAHLGLCLIALSAIGIAVWLTGWSRTASRRCLSVADRRACTRRGAAVLCRLGHRAAAASLVCALRSSRRQGPLRPLRCLQCRLAAGIARLSPPVGAPAWLVGASANLDGWSCLAWGPARRVWGVAERDGQSTSPGPNLVAAKPVNPSQRAALTIC
jgi:hypothetical protein